MDRLADGGLERQVGACGCRFPDNGPSAAFLVFYFHIRSYTPPFDLGYSQLRTVHTKVPDGLIALLSRVSDLPKSSMRCNASQILSVSASAVFSKRVCSSVRRTSTRPPTAHRLSRPRNPVSRHTHLTRHTATTHRPHAVATTRHALHPALHKLLHLLHRYTRARK